MKDKQRIRLLQVVMVIGLGLILLGHYFISYANYPEKYGVTGIIISAMCVAVGIIMSLPTKIYLTILLMRSEEPSAQDPCSKDNNIER
ncbi:hypothetical protein [Psychrobium sp. 1_MG-2023]|uniref:hypothetical protein n=1 Tax=Psychrobium sp. 1_MG-2023 TaxID=3062624 RepID=UPI000C325BD4|nr:hypothetical protein [Psychrobium sp. 1_MG-2023]MDP2560446.1 hypothetical protein [Psychrobium sp. 1_MG-2023]PKF57894.1 hypothetical protein CW748_05080 [Alteromonadales bacterium alter-6D02]